MSDLEEYDMKLVIKGLGILFASIILLVILCQPKVKIIETKCNKEVEVKVVHDTVNIIDTVCPERETGVVPVGQPTDWVGDTKYGYVITAKIKRRPKKGKKKSSYHYYLTDSSERGFALATSNEYEVGDTLDFVKK